MRKFILILLILFTSNNLLFGQDIINKLSQKICKCAEKEKVKEASGLSFCFEKIIVNNLKKIKESYGAKTIDDLDMKGIGNKISANLIKNCDYIIDTFPNGIVGSQEKITRNPKLKCDNLKSGDFYYLTKVPNSGSIDTTFVTITSDMFFERMKNGRTYSLLKIKWKDDCKFDLIFQESNDPIKKELSKKGDIYQYEILTNGNKSFYLKTIWRKRSYQFEMFKMD